MRIAKQIQLPDYKNLKGKVSESFIEFLGALYNHLQAYNRQVQETIKPIEDSLTTIEGSLAASKSGTEVIDNGANRITKVYTQGLLTSVTVAASGGATISWTDA